MSNLEVLEADPGGGKPSIKAEKDVEFSESSLQVNTQPESEKLPWLVGDIVWSKIPGHPWWPSLIAHEPNTAVYFKIKGRTRYYHVQFFGTEPMRGWVTERNVLKYEGKSHFLSLRLSVHGKQHKIGNKQLPIWETAIKMADEALPLNHQERQVCFNFVKFSEIPNTEIEQGPDNKMPNATPGKMGGSPEEVLTDSDEPPTKKARVDKMKHDNAKPQNKTPRNNSKNTVKQTNVTTPKQTKTTPGKQVNNKLTKQVNNKLDKQVNNKLDKQVHNNLEKQVKKKQIKDKCIVVNHSPTSCTVQMNINPKTPENGNRKRGRPRKDLVFVVGNNKDEQAVTLAKKPKTEKSRPKMNALPNNLSSPSAESEKSDGASDTNSTSSMDTESRKSVSKTKDICTVCEKPDDLLICEGICNSAYHKDCLTSDVLSEKFICDKCSSGNHTCFICTKTNNVIKCSSQNCSKFYHLDCIKTLDPKINGENFVCPLHHCNVCGASKSSNSKRRLTCCTRCPVAYHSGTCIVAGSLPITSQYLVCNRHFMADPKKAHHSHVNVNWCFVCSIGGTLICCESCPAAFHAECIEETGIPEGRFFCRDCKDGKELLYGEIVWVKLGMYRWWPAEICNPNNIPTNIQRMKHQPGEFPVQFLGSHDYYWIHRGRVFSYQEGDKGSIGSGGKYLAEIFKKALVEAQEKYAEWQKAQEEKAEKDLEKLSKKPAAYKHIKINRYTSATRYEIDELEWSTCDCSINDENPCGPDSHCLNRILYVECSPLKCPAKEKCQNQCFVKRQYVIAEPFRAAGRGWGLRAKADAKKGQFVNEYVGELINDQTCRERVRKGINDGVSNYYMLTIDKDCIIDAGPMGNLSRFMNHCCDPNCETQKWTVNGEVRVGLFAKRDIKESEELVFDYQLDCLGNEKKKCSCGSENCSGFLGVRPKTQHALKLQEDKKKNQESKKKKRKSGNKKNVDGARGKPQAHGLVPGDLGSSERNDEDIKPFDKTPEAFQVSELEFDEHKTIIERILVCNNDDEQLNNINFKTFNQTVARPAVESLKQETNPDMTSSISTISNDLTHQTSIIPSLTNDQLNRKENTTGSQSFPNFPSSGPTTSHILSNLDTSPSLPASSGPTTSHILSNLDTSPSLPASDNIPSVESLFNSQINQVEIFQTNPVTSGFVNSLNPVQLPNSSFIRPNSSTTANAMQCNLPSDFNCHSNSSITSTKLPSLPHNIPTSQVQRSLQSTTLSQFTPKGTPVVSHAFHNLGPKALGPSVEASRYGTRSTFPARHVSAPRDLDSNTSLAVKSESQYLNPESSQ